MDWKFVLRLAKVDGSFERDVTMWRDESGGPLKPNVGEYIFMDDGSPYEVKIVNWNYQTQKLIVIAVRTA